MLLRGLETLMKAVAVTVLVSIALTRVGTGIAAPMADLARSPLNQPRALETSALRDGFLILPDGARYSLGSRVGLFVDYKEMKAVNGALGSLETGLPAMPPVRLGRFLVSAGIRVNLN